jgi:hypothetical protein
MTPIAEDNYSPLNKTLLSVFNAYKKGGYSALFVFRDGWGELMYAAVKPRTPAWDAFEHAAAPYGVKQPLIAFDLKHEYADQMPGHFLESLETLDAFAYSPLIYIPGRDGRIPALERQRALRDFLRPQLTSITNDSPPESSRRSPPAGKLRLV